MGMSSPRPARAALHPERILVVTE